MDQFRRALDLAFEAQEAFSRGEGTREGEAQERLSRMSGGTRRTGSLVDIRVADGVWASGMSSVQPVMAGATLPEGASDLSRILALNQYLALMTRELWSLGTGWREVMALGEMRVALRQDILRLLEGVTLF